MEGFDFIEIISMGPHSILWKVA